MVKGIIYFIIATVALLFGAVQPWIFSFYALLMIVGFGVFMWQGRLLWQPGVWAWGIVGFSLVVTLVQVMPFSIGFLEVVSPFRAQILAQASEILGAGDQVLGAGYAIAYSVPRALARWGFIVCLGLFFWVCVSLGKDRKGFKGMVWVLMGLGVFESVYGLFQVLFPGVGVWWEPLSSPGCASGTYIGRNNFAGFMEMVWPVALGVTLAQGEWEEKKGLKALLAEEHVGKQLLGFLMVVLMVLALLFSRSRAGIVGGFVGMAVLVGILRAASGRFRWGLRIVLLLMVALVAIYGGQIGFDKILERFLQLDGNAGNRIEIFKQSWEMVTDHPAGTGLGNFQIVEPVYVNTAEGFRNYHAHNDYLQLLIEAGWVGAVVLVFGLFFFIVRAVRRIRKVGFDVGRFRLLVSVGALAGICSLAFHGFFDFNFQIPANQIYFVLLLALVEAGLWPKKQF